MSSMCARQIWNRKPGEYIWLHGFNSYSWAPCSSLRWSELAKLNLIEHFEVFFVHFDNKVFQALIAWLWKVSLASLVVVLLFIELPEQNTAMNHSCLAG